MMFKALKSSFILFVKACVSYLQLLELKQNLKRTCLEQYFRCATQIHIRIWKTSIADGDLNKISMVTFIWCHLQNQFLDGVQMERCAENMKNHIKTAMPKSN